MAQSKPHTPGTARGAKLIALLIDEGTALLRRIFEDEIQKMNPPSLREQLKRHERYLCGLRYLNPGQRKTLYPDSGNVSDTAQGFDISLLELLLKEIVCYELGRDAPYSGVRDRLRRFRNDNYGHISSTDLSEADFGCLWGELTRILVALGGDRDKISDRLNSSIDPELESKYFELLERLHKQDLILAQLESLRKGQEEVLDQGKSLLKGQETLTQLEESQKKVQEEVLHQVKGQEAILAQGQSQRKEILDQSRSMNKELKEIKSLLENNRDAQSPGTNSGQCEDSRSRTVLEHVRDKKGLGTSNKLLVSAEPSCQTDQGAGSSEVPDDVITCLKDLYATEYAHVRPMPWCEDLKLHLEDIYTDLKLQRGDGRGVQFKETSTVVSFADIYNTTACRDSRVNVRKIRVEGDPGIGKSCSCQKLAYDWSCGKLARFKAVFFLEMRQLAGKVKDEIFKQLLPKDTNTTPDQLWSYIQQNQNDVLFILDGLDELSQAARQVTDVVDLIQGKILRNCHVLVTSRPYHCVTDLEKCHQFYRIVGFSKKNSEEFIRKYFCESPESASKLVKQLDSNRNLSELVVNPLNNVLICVVWEDNKEQLPSSKAELYKMIVLSVAKRFCKKNKIQVEGDELPPDIEAALRGLGKLSWEGLEQEQLQFNIAEVKKKYGTNMANNMLDMGLLTREYSLSRIIYTPIFGFLHKTYQEYMAARYISGLVRDGSSREEGVKCLRSLFGLTNTTGVDRELISLAHYTRFEEVQKLLLLILGENANPLFDMFAEELDKAQTDEDRELLSFVCLTWLGRTECAGVKMAKIVAPCLSQHATNNLPLNEYYDRTSHWFVGLARALKCQRKLPASSNPRLIQHLTIDCRHICKGRSILNQEKFDLMRKTLSDYSSLRSLTLHEDADMSSLTSLQWEEGCFHRAMSNFVGGDMVICHTFPPLFPFIPPCGTGSVSIHINPHSACNRSLPNSLQQLSEGPSVEHIRITSTAFNNNNFKPTRDTDFSEYDRLLAQMIVRQNRLRSLKLEIGELMWFKCDGFGNLAETLQGISQHTKLEVVEFELPWKGPKDQDEVYLIFKVDPMVRELTECIKRNKVLKTLRLSSTVEALGLSKRFYGVCSPDSLSRLCSAIQENRTLETLEIEGMFCNADPCINPMSRPDLWLFQSGGYQEIIDKLMRNKPSNYKELSITLGNNPLTDNPSDHDRWFEFRGIGALLVHTE